MDCPTQFLQATRRAFTIPGMIWPREMFALAQLFGGSKRHAEIGVFCGKSLYVTAASMSIFGGGGQGKHLVAVDCFSVVSDYQFVPSEKWWRQVMLATQAAISDDFGITVEFLDMPSLQAAVKYKDAEPFDSVYIDANHAEEYIESDLRSWWPLIRAGGTIAGHDYSADFLGVMNAVNNTFSHNFKVLPDTRVWYAIKDQETSNTVRFAQGCA